MKSKAINLKVPSDLFGLNAIELDDDACVDLGVRLRTVCTAVTECVSRLGAR